MILGLGNDIIEIHRIKDALEKNPRFLSRVFTEKETEYFLSRKMKIESIAGGFAAKEAVSKALGTGFRDFSMKDIEVLRDRQGKPFAILHKNALKTARQKGIKEIHISITHSREFAFAVAAVQ